MSNAQPTPALVREFWAFMNHSFNARVVAKGDAAAMRAAAVALDAMGISDNGAFMKRFATTVGRRIFLPFTPGEVSGKWDLWKQLCTGAHEHEHIAQLDRDGSLRFAWRYLRSAATRAQYEAEARTSELELHFWRFGSLPQLESVVEGLASYSMGKADRAAALATVRSNAEAVRRGAILTLAGKTAIRWLDAHAPELQRAPQAK